MEPTINQGEGPGKRTPADSSIPLESVSGPQIPDVKINMVGPHFDAPVEPPTEKPQPAAEGKGSKIPENAAEMGRAIAKFARSIWVEGGVVASDTKAAVIEGGKILSQELGSRVSAGFEKIAAKPEEQQSTVRELVKIIPGVGEVTRYIDAWKLWNEGVAKNDETLMTKARKECLIALFDLKIDIILLGSTKLVSAAGRVIRSITGPVALNRIARGFGLENLDIVEGIAGKVANKHPAKGIAEYILKSVKPHSPKELTPEQSAKMEQDLNFIVTENAGHDEEEGPEVMDDGLEGEEEGRQSPPG